MVKKKGKSVSFDAMVKFFINSYEIPTKRDIASITTRLDRIERMVSSVVASRSRRKAAQKASGKSGVASASDIVLEIIRQHNDGIGLADIQLLTGFGDKKLRNILFRLHKAGKITRKRRGIYIGA